MSESKARAGLRHWLAYVQIALLLLVVLLLVRGGGARNDGQEDSESVRDLASRLRAAGALDESAALMEEYIRSASPDPSTRSKIAYSLGQSYLDSGRPERALRWFYEAEDLDDGPLREEVARKIVHTLERMGRHHAAQTALESRVKLQPAAGRENVRRADSDPVVARLGEREIRRSDIERSLDELPGGLAALGAREQKEAYLRRFVADELLYRKARKLEYDKDPDVERSIQRVVQQMTISKFVQQEVLGEIEIDESDLLNFFEANRGQFSDQNDQEVELGDVRQVVQQAYLQTKAQAAYQQLIDSELQTAEIELFPERLSDG